ncbi:glycosyltransferase family 2 protein [Falsihalocynthiibacter sp. S25ZX9]|uniref:glycosyltransferase family 2 protein n=1 Tax=Falsihalocynthiibacter sp. S25ZX9 TaxID=3240870 RepID=UPI00350F6CAD
MDTMKSSQETGSAPLKGHHNIPASVSIVIPCYNAQSYVSQAINSVLVDAAEVIAVDDGSTDGTLSVLQSFNEHIFLKTGPNQGACSARNEGLAMARGKYVMFLDADDWLEPDTLLGLVSRLEETGAKMAIAPVVRSNLQGNRSPFRVPRTENLDYFLSDWLSGRYLPPCGILWRANFVRSIGGWNEALSKNQDGDLVLRAAQNGAQTVRSKIGCSVYRDHDGIDRISNTISETKLRDSFAVTRDACDRASQSGPLSEELNAAFSRATHALERLAAQNGIPDALRDFGAFRASRGWPKAEGGFAHTTASHLLGLRRKENLALFARKIIGKK